MSKRTARAIINVCDWMIGYHGRIIEEAIQGIGMSIMFAAMFLVILAATI